MNNFSAIGAICLFGAAHLNKKWQVFAIPVVAALISDLLINIIIYRNFYGEFTWLTNGFYWQYGSYILITLFGILLFNRISVTKVISGAVGSGIIFYLISNFGAFILSPAYPHNIGGLLTCYMAGIPFISGTLLGNLFYSGLLFGSFALLQQKFVVLRTIDQERG
jgi:hypothetical protein